MMEGISAIAAKKTNCSRNWRFRLAMRNAVCGKPGLPILVTAKYTSGATIIMLVILMRNDSEIAIAATKNDEGSPCSTQRRKKYRPTIAKLSEGTSGMNERPAKTFTGAK